MQDCFDVIQSDSLHLLFCQIVGLLPQLDVKVAKKAILEGIKVYFIVRLKLFSHFIMAIEIHRF